MMVSSDREFDEIYDYILQAAQSENSVVRSMVV